MTTYKVTVDNYGTTRWYNEVGQFHRENGPAIEYAHGTKVWYLNGKLHRDNGPAVEYADGRKVWYLNNKLHRVDGPTIEYADGRKVWYLNNKQLTEVEFKLKTQSKKTCEGKMVEVDGVKYKLVRA